MKRGELDNVESHNDMIQLEEKSRRTRRELNRKARSKNKNAHDDALSLSLSLSLVPRTGAKNPVYCDQRIIRLGPASFCMLLHSVPS